MFANLRLWDRQNFKKSLKMQFIRKHLGDLATEHDVTYTPKGKPGEGAKPQVVVRAGTKIADMTPEQIYQVSKEIHTALNSQAKAGEAVHTGREREGRPTIFHKPSPQRGKPSITPSGVNVKPSDRIGKAGAIKSNDEVALLKDQVNKALRKAGYKGPDVEVSNFKEVPKELQRLTKSTKALGGYRAADGTIHVNAIPHDSIADAIFTAFHELFHRGELGVEAKPYMDALTAAKTNRVVGDIVRAIESKAAFGKTEAISEALADIGAAKKSGDWARLQAKYGVKMDAFSKASASSALQKFIGRATEFFKRLFGTIGKHMTNEEVHALVDHVYSQQNKKILNPLEGARASLEYDEPTLKKQAKIVDQLESRLANWWRNRPTGEFGTGNVAKTAKLAIDIHRASILSGLYVVGKIADAVGIRLIRGHLERAVINGLSKLPVLKEAAKRAPLYSAGYRGDLQAQAFGKMANELIPQMKQALKTGSLDIDKFRQYSEAMAKDIDEEVLPSRWLDLPVRIHKATKAAAQLNTFNTSSALRFQHDLAENMSRGMSSEHAMRATKSPKAQLARDIASYVDSQRDIFMDKNALHSWLEDKIRQGAKSENPLAKTASFAAQMLLPVRKIGTNFLKETVEHIPGLGAGKSVGLVMRMMKQGAQSLSGEDANYLLRNLSRQTIGAVATALTYAYFSNNLGGLYVSREDYKDKTHPHPRDIKTPLGTISGRLLHDPLIDMAHTVATYIHESNKKNKSGEKESGGRAAWNTGLALAADIPTVDFFKRIQDAASSEYAMKRYVDNMVSSFVIPTGVADIAKMKDVYDNPDVTGRKTKDLQTTLQAGLPGPREDLPAYKD